jgi:hypothetical protein
MEYEARINHLDSENVALLPDSEADMLSIKNLIGAISMRVALAP